MAIKEELADLLADQILRLLDALVGVDVDRRMGEQPDRIDRNGDERRIVLVQRVEIEGQPQLGGFELALAHHAVEGRRRKRVVIGEIDALGLDAAVHQRARAIVIPARQGHLQIGHFHPPFLGRILSTSCPGITISDIHVFPLRA